MKKYISGEELTFALDESASAIIDLVIRQVLPYPERQDGTFATPLSEPCLYCDGRASNWTVPRECKHAENGVCSIGTMAAWLDRVRVARFFVPFVQVSMPRVRKELCWIEEVEETGPEVGNQQSPNAIAPGETRKRRTLLKIIAALCKESDIDLEKRGAAMRIMEATDRIGVTVKDDTIRKIIDEIPDALE